MGFFFYSEQYQSYKRGKIESWYDLHIVRKGRNWYYSAIDGVTKKLLLQGIETAIQYQAIGT